MSCVVKTPRPRWDQQRRGQKEVDIPKDGVSSRGGEGEETRLRRQNRGTLEVIDEDLDDG